jgi:hypothetical protein
MRLTLMRDMQVFRITQEERYHFNADLRRNVLTFPV